ncbi:hypothetical protein HpBGD119_14780 [Helicobacter pylori]
MAKRKRLKPPKKNAFFKRLSLELGFPLTKNTKKGFFIKPPPKNKNLKSGLKNQKKEKD